MKRWWLVIALLLSLGTNIGVLAMQTVGRLAGGQQQPLRPIIAGRLPKVADHLGIEGEARQQFLERHRRFIKETAAPRKRLNEIRLAERAELISAHPDQQRIEQLTQEAARIFLGLERRLATLVLETRATLPPAAAARYVDLISRLKIEGPGAYGRLPPPLTRWFRTGSPPPDGMPPPEVQPKTTPPAPGSPSAKP